jgi:predicted GTPase
MDLLTNKESFINSFYTKQMQKIYIKPQFISSKKRSDIISTLSKLILIFKNSQNKDFAHKLDDNLKQIIEQSKHPLIGNKPLKFYFGRVISYRPLNILIYVNVFKHQVKKTYQRYIENEIKKSFNIVETPIKLIFLKKK